jgi:16S rRNA (cytosine967-C5)-methyltransferase
VKYSYPKRLSDKWIADFGFQFTKELMIEMNKEPKLTIRPNSLKISQDELANLFSNMGKHIEVNGISLICDGFDVAHDEFYKNGFYTVQDTAASNAAIILNPKAGETVIDMCSAPGGKTTHMAELMNNKGKILAFDVHEHKIKLIEENAKRLGIDIIEAGIGDGTVMNKSLLQSADKVLCDVPCSGLGIIRRKPDIKWNKDDVSGLYEIQKKILENGAAYLKNGGELVYSTCTIDKDENENVTSEFLENHNDFEKLYEKTYYPNVDKTDGFYICKMRKL